MIFEKFTEESQVWIYGADRFLNTQEEIFIQNNIDSFISKWATHGTELVATGGILHHNFIVIVSDESNVRNSGCSIDSSVRFIKDLGRELNIDFFNRLSVLLEKEGIYKRVHFKDLSLYQDWNMFDPMVKNLKDLREKWEVLVGESPFVN